MLLTDLECWCLLGFVILCSVCNVNAETKVWRRNTNFNNPSNWEPNLRPSEEVTAVFPSMTLLDVMLPDAVTLCELVLSNFGSLIMPSNGHLQFSNHPCDPYKEMYFNRLSYERWDNPSNWWSKNFQRATPHATRIPCPFDDVVFLPNRTFAVQIPPVPIGIKSFTINNQEMDAEGVRSFFLESPIGRSQFQYTHHGEPYVPYLTGSGCGDPTGCSCGTERMVRMSCQPSAICGVVECLDPVRPTGHCCDICGAVLQFNYDAKKFKLSELKFLMDSHVDMLQSQRGVELVYHAGKTDGGKIQVVLIEKTGYTGLITDEMLEDLRKKITADDSFGLNATKILLAGEPYDPYQTTSVLKTFVFLILLTLIGYMCFVVYGSDINFSQLLGSPRINHFVRFENQAAGVELRYEVEPSIRKSFHNPLSAILQAVSRAEESSEVEDKPEEEPSTSYGHLTQETSEPEPPPGLDDVEMGEIPKPSSEEKPLHEVDLS